ncbi:MAG: hypothetical protein P1U53_16770 [Sulfitobacter sp.]|nr:hypothetical protein [Sulfitobacter sp.]
MTLRRIIALLGAALCVALSLYVARSSDDPLTRTAQSYAADMAAKSAATYVTLRTLNAVLSTAQELEVGVSFIASGTAQPLKVLEPVDDTVERIAGLVFGVMVATGVLAVALGPVSALGLALLALALLLAAFFPERRMARPLGWYGLFFGLALPVSLALATPLAESLTQATYARNLVVVNEITRQVGGNEEIVARELGINDYRKIAGNVWNRADELIGAMVAIVGVYVFRLFILPLLLIGGLFMAARGLARTRPTSRD